MNLNNLGWFIFLGCMITITIAAGHFVGWW
jgi:hypothetical protein